ncbi:PREDICTED: uncharacterized protein LOC105557203 [Vollenhovia emeryi]|uniref:uncharacterized protein LOC105557203 n=1 Tax=Vollenhovia emeryi TaxID=411798 RepID=UPI0005F50ABD|nr:PREDICTED: uncharacterized protein LOC105557203 [Vollenhovia emeryi]
MGFPSTMAEGAAKLLAKQQQLQRIIERAVDNFKKIGRNNLTAAKIHSRISSLKESWILYLNGHADLERAVSEADQRTIAYFKDNCFEPTEETYQEALDYMTEALEEIDPPVSLDQSACSTTRASASEFPRSQMPAISLPPFDGSYDKWEHFRDRFTSLIIHNKDLRNFARMQYLASSVTGSALDCICDLKVTAENFDVAWKALEDRFENKRRLLGVHLSALLNLPIVPRESANDLRTLVNKASLAVASLNNLQRTSAELWHDMLVHLVVQRVDSATRKAWNVKANESDAIPSFDTFIKFMKNRALALEDFAQPNGGPSTPNASGQAKSRKVHASTASASAPASASPSADAASAKSSSCPICKGRHFFRSCPSFVEGSPSQRLEAARQHKRCLNCLAHGHISKNCNSKYTCRTCSQKHHTMLHGGWSPGTTSPGVASTTHLAAATSGAPPSVEASTEIQSLSASLTAQPGPSHILLATAWIAVHGACGRSLRVRALLDQGSEMTFISENLAQNLRLKRIRMPVTVSAIGGVSAGTYPHASAIEVAAIDSRAAAVSTTAVILPTLTKYVPRRVAAASSLEHLRDLRWADPDPTSADPIQIILGADVFSDILLEGVRKGDRAGEPIAQCTIFGWVISGPIGPISNGTEALRASSQISVHHCAYTSSLDEDLKRFWEVEEPPTRSSRSAEDEECERHFRETHARADDGRYIVRLPFKKGPPIDIGDSRGRANALLASLVRRLQRNPGIAADYRNFMAEYERLGHMRRAPVSSGPQDTHVFIPHHPVLREDSATTRLRVVFNASSVTSNGTSLNDHLHSGPKLQAELPAVLLRWREFHYVCSADISKMFRQILVDPRDRNYQKILWPSSNAAATEYQLCTVTYGTASAPYLALRVLQQLADDDGPKFPAAAHILRQNIYVDDVLFGHDDVTALRQHRNQLVELLLRGGFELRNKTLAPDEKLKILGIGWSPSPDVFQFRVAIEHPVPTSKRSILSAIAKLYDPLGWVTPVTIAAKILIQQLWKLKLTWDEVVPSSTLSRWTQIYSRLPCLAALQIPRWTDLGADVNQAELHGFADASNAAYAAVVYLRVTSRTGAVTISLITGKSRVAPLRTLSVPRLELAAVVLLANLVEFVRDSLRFDTISCHCWTDSTIVLAWLAQSPDRWKTFVANRVADVQARLPNVKWRHVATHENPADCASRGLLGDEALAHQLWWQGPSWLRLPAEEWPTGTPDLPATAPLEEKVVALHVQTATDRFDVASRYSSWPRLIRVTAYLFRFIARCRRAVQEASRGPREGRVVRAASKANLEGRALDASECRATEKFWIKRIQAEVFRAEISAILNHREISSKSPLLSLRPFIDHEGVLRVGGRLKNAPVPFNVRHPIVIASHGLVRLLIEHTHKRMLHSGLQLTLSQLRRDFWLVGARRLVKSVIHKCVVCARERAAIPSQLMGNLPAVRVTAASRSFLHCGLDYAGPVFVRASSGRGVTSRKAYIALFVCLATRAIHLELVCDYSTPAFLNAFSRFTCRRGLPEAMYSDNGTTFTGADRELAGAYRQAMRDPAVQNKIATDKVAWHFIPPSAPHFGGIWEAGVRSVKHHLRRVLGSHKLTYEEFTTLLCRIEACLNSRPIAPLSDVLEDYEVLTPGHFLIGAAITSNPEPSLLDLNEDRLSRWQIVRHVTERFWKLWQADYINTLQQRGKWRRTHPPVKIGQIVLLKNPALPPCKWELGRVTQVHPGSDNLTRVVTVKTASSEYRRPIVKLLSPAGSLRRE